jgi:hypothetical protein
MKLAVRGILIVASLSLAAAALARTAAPASTAAPARPKTPVFVRDFPGSCQPSSESRGGPLSRLRGTRASEKASPSASTLSKDVVREFVAR